MGYVLCYHTKQEVELTGTITLDGIANTACEEIIQYTSSFNNQLLVLCFLRRITNILMG